MTTTPSAPRCRPRRRRFLDAADLRVKAAVPESIDRARAPSGPFGIASLEENERHLVRVLDARRGRAAAAAHALGVPRSSLCQRLERPGVPLGRDSSP
ncbi:MAG TPA: hypothetical protein VHE35_18330 [Kofleriaceae bacterium]|nr:hypothetical protein [Kofleriaceae bacterium]